jgi:hypothetical protein
MQTINPGENPRRRAILQALEEAQERYEELSMTSVARARLASEIVRLEDALSEFGES